MKKTINCSLDAVGHAHSCQKLSYDINIYPAFYFCKLIVYRLENLKYSVKLLSLSYPFFEKNAASIIKFIKIKDDL